MASPQVEDGFTKIANEILEQSARVGLNGTQFRILLIVWRYTYGFGRKSHEFAINFLAEATKSHRNQIQREVTVLVKLDILRIVSKGNNRTKILSFNKDYESWETTNQRTPKQLISGDLFNEGKQLISGDQNNGLVVQVTADQRTKKERKKDLKKDLTRQQKTYAEDSSYFLMAVYLHQKIVKMAEAENFNHASIKNADMQKWADEFRKIVEIDKVTDKRLIYNLINWVTTDSFWKVNILSPKKLREKFSELALKMKVGKPNKPDNAEREQQIAREEAFREWVRAGHDPNTEQFVYEP